MSPIFLLFTLQDDFRQRCIREWKESSAYISNPSVKLITGSLAASIGLSASNLRPQEKTKAWGIWRETFRVGFKTYADAIAFKLAHLNDLRFLEAE